MQELPEPSIRARLIVLGIGLLLALPLGAIFGGWTYEGFSTYRARNSVPSGLEAAGAVVEDVWDRSGEGSFRSIFWGTLVGYVLAIAAGVTIALREEDLFWWPPVSFGVALGVGILVLAKRIRRLREPTR